MIAATIVLVLMPEAQGEAEPTTQKGPVDASHAPKESLGTHEASILTEGVKLPFLEIGAHGPDTDVFPIPKTAQEEDLTRQIDSPTFETDEEVPSSEGRRGEEHSPETTPSPPAGSCDDPLALVDQRHPLPEYYVPKDLVPLGYYGTKTLHENAVLRREAAEGLARLMEAAEAAGEDLVVASAYRSFGEQRAIHAELTALYGEGAERFSAQPGHSEHQLGTTVDFTNTAAEYRVWSVFEDTGAYRWLLEHARDYGFVQSYERGKEGETGYEAESWHYRYVGAENAQHLEATDLSLRAFLLREGVLPRCD